MKSAIIVFPGSNRERDMAMALQAASGQAPDLIWHKEVTLPAVDLIVLPGGFSHGDYLRAGAMAARAPIMAAVIAKAAAGTPVLAVCNGFQILTECGLLPGALMRNAGLKFICRNVDISVEQNHSMFTRGYHAGQHLQVPVAHNDGNYFADTETLDRLEGEGQVAFRYADSTGAVTAAGNINGSQRNIAGILNAKGNVLGFMPHPENAVDPRLGGTDGAALFSGLVEAIA
jgi:phosphoribosylformylglycinamidine synthase